ncbi:MAG: site-specific DNA-methyltransferase, partial [Candidatus Ureaplasma intestinipullorum]|nr:site-specific DNA-methyltransferase [Candidatus Ureaplasma intestinipullorum]
IQPVTGNKRALYKLLGEFNENIKEVIIWNKVTGQPAMAKNVMNSVFEYIIVFAKDKNDSISRQFKESNFNRGTLNNVWNIKRKRSVSNEHSATFPEELVENIILNFTKKNEIILDPFSGTGTTGISCIKNNRRYIGIELLENYFNTSINRFKNIINITS